MDIRDNVPALPIAAEELNNEILAEDHEEAPFNPEDQPLPMPADAGVPPSIHKIYVVFNVGKKFESRVLDTPFEDIETGPQLAAVHEVLSKQCKKRVEIVNWKPLES